MSLIILIERKTGFKSRTAREGVVFYQHGLFRVRL